MAKTFRQWNPEQTEMFPASPLDLVKKDELVHLVRSLVLEELDLGEIYSQYREERGYPPFHPGMMTALILYSYSQRIYSTRRMARACQQRVDFMALTGMQKPDFRTINLFRQRHLGALKGLFGQVLRVCAKAGLVRLGHVAVDGTRIKANANKRNGMTYGEMKKAEADYEEEVRGWFEEADRIDQEEDERYGADKSGDEMPEWMSDETQRRKKIQEAMAELESEAKAEAERGADPEKTRVQKKPTGKPAEKAYRNFTDPGSRLMPTKEGFIAGYNAQAAVDSAHQVIVAQTLTQSSNDMQQMIPLLQQIRSHLGRQAKEVSADAGYCSQRNLKALVQRHIRGYIATDRQRKDRNVNRWVQRMRARLARGAQRSRYRLRMQIVEPVFGQIKHGRGFRQFLLRGKDKVAAEWSLLCTAHNLLKLAAARG
jgi:transposase